MTCYNNSNCNCNYLNDKIFAKKVFIHFFKRFSIYKLLMFTWNMWNNFTIKKLWVVLTIFWSGCDATAMRLCSSFCWSFEARFSLNFLFEFQAVKTSIDFQDPPLYLSFNCNNNNNSFYSFLRLRKNFFLDRYIMLYIIL